MPTAFPFRLLVLTLLAAAISAQQTEESLRGPAVGEVSDRSGGPWAGVEVVLVSRPLPHNPNVGEVDRVVATADARGRFHAEILRGRPYSAWAWGEAADDGRSATAVAERVFVQRPVVLREQRRLPRRTLVLDQMDRWKICRGFVVRVVDQTDNRLVQWLEVKDGKAVLPFLVGTDAFVEVFADLGERRCPLARQRVEASDPAGDLHVALPERQHVTCWVRDAGSEKPRAGATVFRRLGGALYPAGVTDADGKLLLDIAKVESPSPEFSTLVLADQQMFGICQRVGSNHFPPKPSLPEGAGAEDLFANLR